VCTRQNALSSLTCCRRQTYADGRGQPLRDCRAQVLRHRV